MEPNKHSRVVLGRDSELNLLYLIVITALPLFFVVDGVSKILLTYSFEFHRASLIIRIVYEFLFVSLIVTLLNYTRISILILLAFLLVLFLINQFVLASVMRDAFSENIITFNKYTFIFILYAAVYKLQSDQQKLNKCVGLLEILFVLNSALVLLGPLTGLEFLKTYVHSDYRYGYMGLIVAQNEATLFYFLAVSLAYYKRYVLRIKHFTFFLILAASMLLGTKGIYLFLALLFVFHNIYYARNRFFIIIGIGLLLFQFVKFATSDEGKIFLIYFYSQSESGNLFSMLLSGRDALLISSFSGQLKEWSLLNYLIGGQNVLKYATELDFFDLFLFFGFLGGVIYLTLYFYTVFKFKKTKFTVFFIACYFILAGFGGHFFASAVNSLYMCLITMYIYATLNLQPGSRTS